MSDSSDNRQLRIGSGFDVHAFEDACHAGSHIVIGGVAIEHERRLLGHSDADVLCHAIGDALLGAMGEADIGNQFSNSDERYRDISSLVLLDIIVEKLRQRGGIIYNIDTTLLAQRPLFAPHIEPMKQQLSKTLHLSPTQIGIKATTTERLGCIGREEGIAAFAVALIACGREK